VRRDLGAATLVAAATHGGRHGNHRKRNRGPSLIHNYRWRLGLADGEARYDDLERQLAEAPVISVPTITLEGDANGAPHPEPSAYAGKFSGGYSHRTIEGGIGHNLPQEAPEAFAQAAVDVDSHERRSSHAR
jgi:pimeloyl-ACP methyl ester carboxylesterase